MCIHHLIVDSVSWRIIVEDLNQLYAALVNETSCCLALKTTSFQEWSEFIENYSDSEELRIELPYWENVQNGVNKSMLTKSSNSNNNEEFLLGESKLILKNLLQMNYCIMQEKHTILQQMIC